MHRRDLEQGAHLHIRSAEEEEQDGDGDGDREEVIDLGSVWLREDVEDEEVDELKDESDVAILILICKRHQSHSQELFKKFFF